MNADQPDPVAVQMRDETALAKPLHIVPHKTWPVALCGFVVERAAESTAGRDRCTECLRLARGHSFVVNQKVPEVRA